MSNLHLITGRAGEKHVSAADDGALNAAAFGSGKYVLNEGGKMAATVVSNNAVRIADGAVMFHGRYIRLEGYEDITIESGTQGTYRNDLIVVRYTKDTTANTESAQLVVIKGAASGSTAVDPAYVNGNILEGAVQADMPLYRIPLDNVNIGTPVALYEMMESNIGNLDSKQDNTASLSIITAIGDSDSFPVYEVSSGKNRRTAWSNIVSKMKTAIWGTKSGFIKADGSGGISGVSTIPIANGGTGATSRKTAARNLMFLGTDPVTVDTDTTTQWAALGTGYADITKSGVITDQPSTYGFIENYVDGAIVVQVWCSIGSSAVLCHRSGNASGWFSSWISNWNNKNLTPARIGAAVEGHTHTAADVGAVALGSNGKAIASQISAKIINISESTTLGASHCGTFIQAYNSKGTDITLTIPDSTDLPVETEIEVFRLNSGAVKIAAASTVTMRGRGTNATDGETYLIPERYASAVLKKVSTTMWCISGAECVS